MKNRVIELLKRILRVFYLFPIKNNRVVFSAYSGKNYSCNPKYICEALLRSSPENLEIIWAFKDPLNVSTDLRIKKVKFKSIKYLYYVMTARVVVDNVESWSILPSRSGQEVINTWHGGGSYKGVGLYRRDTSRLTNENMLNKFKRVTLFLSSSVAFTQQTIRNSFHYTGKVLECGMPRNDILLHNNEAIKEKVKKELNIHDSNVVLYAPTFRKEKKFEIPFDVDVLLGALTDRFGGSWVILVREHYYIHQHIEREKCIDVSDYPDMQELLALSDILITDYSSSIWDFALTGKPAFLFTYDLDLYTGEREFYSPISEWPYPHANTFHDLLQLISSFDLEKNKERIDKHLTTLRSRESGNASVITAEYIESVMKGTCH